MDFELMNPKDSDFHSIQMFLRNYLDGEQYDSGALADLICKQGEHEIGSIIKVPSEDITPATIKNKGTAERETQEDFFHEGFGFISVIHVQNLKVWNLV